jgi:hypothetical protein
MSVLSAFEPCPCGSGHTAYSVQDVPWDGEWPADSCISRIQKDRLCHPDWQYNQSFIDNNQSLVTEVPDELVRNGVKDLQTLVAALREHKFKYFWMQSILTIKGERPEWTVDLDYDEGDTGELLGITFTVTEFLGNMGSWDEIETWVEVDEIYHPPVYLDLTTSQFDENGWISKAIPEQLSFLPFRPEISPLVKAARS